MSQGVTTSEFRTTHSERGFNIGLLWRPQPKAPPFLRLTALTKPPRMKRLPRNLKSPSNAAIFSGTAALSRLPATYLLESV